MQFGFKIWKQLEKVTESTFCFLIIHPERGQKRGSLDFFDLVERYYGKCFTSKQELIQMITNYISYYNNRRVQRNLGVLTPFEKHNIFLAA